MTDLQGVWVAMPTPWSADGDIDAGAVRELVSAYSRAGLHGAYTTGTDGELHAMDLPEFTALAAAFGGAAQESGMPAQMGCGWHHTDGVVERARIARDHGVDIIQLSLPGWIPLTDDDIARLFGAVAEQVPQVQIVHYNIARSGRFFTSREYWLVAAEAPTLIGSKHTGGDLASLIEIVHDGPPLAHFVVDTQIMPGAMFGASGFYSFIANLSPALALGLWAPVAAREWEAAAGYRLRVDAMLRQWRASRPATLASPALGKVATAAYLVPDLPLRVRDPYASGTPTEVAQVRRIFAEHFPELVGSTLDG